MTDKEKKEFLEFQIYKLKKQKKLFEEKLSGITEQLKIKSEEFRNMKIKPKKSS